MSRQRPQVLVAEDDRGVREMIGSLLSPEYDVTTATDGTDCWEFLEHRADHPPDIVLLDVMMPNLDGYQTLERVRNDERFTDLPVLMLTARSREEDVVQALRTGADDFLAKPFDGSRLRDHVDRLAR